MTIPIFSPSSIFSTGESSFENYPCARYLPPYYSNSVTKLIEFLLSNKGFPSQASVILDPFGTSPLVDVEIAKRGFPVVVCCNNPINRVLVELFADPPSKEELLPILAEIASLKKGNMRLETFIRSLYQSVCNNCGSNVEIESYIWEKGTNEIVHHLSQKKYHCQNCGQLGEYPITSEDLELFEKIPALEIFELEAANKVVSRNDPQWQTVIDAVRLHPSRSLYVLFTILNKIENLTSNERKQKLLLALMLGIIDYANGLWPYPSRRYRPKQLVLASQFIEHNLWLYLEKAIDHWSEMKSSKAVTPVVYWPKMPKEGEISIFEGRLKELVKINPNLEFPFIVTVLPRPNQAYWTLSAIWTGWLMGKTEVTPLKSVLQRKRYDWGWHCQALFSAFSELVENKQHPMRIIALIEENEPNFLAASLIAGDRAGFELSDFTQQTDTHRAQIGWSFSLDQDVSTNPLPLHIDKELLLRQQMEQALINVIRRGNEPLHFNRAHAIALTNVVHHSKQMKETISNPITLNDLYPIDQINDFPNTFIDILQQVIYDSPIVKAIPEENKSLEYKYIWLKKPEQLIQFSLSDQVEENIYNILQHKERVSYQEILDHVFQKFNGFFTPDKEFIDICLSSYANNVMDSNIWQLREEDQPANRDNDMQEMRSLLHRLADKLNIKPLDSPIILWNSLNGEELAKWIVRTSGMVSDIYLKENTTPNLYLLVPGSRVNLILYKIHHNPILSNSYLKQWKIVRFRQIRWLIEQPDLEINHFDKWLNIDPIKYESPQLSFWQ